MTTSEGGGGRQGTRTCCTWCRGEVMRRPPTCSMRTISTRSGSAWLPRIRSARVQRRGKKPKTINYRTLKPEKDGLSASGSSADAGLGVPLRQVQAGPVQGHHLRALRRRDHPQQGPPRPDGPHRARRPGHPHLVLQGRPESLGYLLDIAPKDLERIIYFAAYVITRIDDDRRQKELPEIEKEINQEKNELEAERDDEIKGRLSELEERLRELEGEGAKGAQLSAARREAQRDVDRITEQTKRERAPRRGPDRVQEPVRQAARGRRRRVPFAPRAVRRLLRRRHGR